IIICTTNHICTCLACRHFAIADESHALTSQALLHTFDFGYIQRVISSFTRQNCRGERQAQWIEHRDVDLDLRQVWPMILAMAKLKQPISTHVYIALGRGAVDAHSCWLQIINSQGAPIECALKGAPGLVIAQLI